MLHIRGKASTLEKCSLCKTFVKTVIFPKRCQVGEYFILVWCVAYLLISGFSILPILFFSTHVSLLVSFLHFFLMCGCVCMHLCTRVHTHTQESLLTQSGSSHTSFCPSSHLVTPAGDLTLTQPPGTRTCTPSALHTPRPRAGAGQWK